MLYLQSSCKDSTGNSHIYFTQFAYVNIFSNYSIVIE